MIIEDASAPRELNIEQIQSDLVVVGGGLSGTCAAIAAARQGLKVVMVQDRPVLGGNASSEVRLWILGATSHGGNNNRWAREGGIINELLLENQFRNPGGNPVVFDSILLDWVSRESNLTVLVNTSVFHAETKQNQIQKVFGFNSQNSTMYHLSGKLFADSTGDGILTHLSGAAYRMGAEDADEFGEPMAPGDDYGQLLGHSLYFYSKNVGHPVDYVAPDFALKDIPTLIPRYKSFKASEQGCSLWWIEWGGRLDTIHQSEEIKLELQKIVYGVWNYIKNSGDFPEAANLALEWVGTIPGKRESRRAEGDYMLRQRDIVEQVIHKDAVSHGGWSIDLHPADGVYGANGGCNQYHAKGVYGIPYRCMYSRNIENLFINGRLLSASHVAFGSTRVMATSSAVGEAIGTAASLCVENKLQPRGLLQDELLDQLKCRLSSGGHFVPHYNALDRENLATNAKVSVSSEMALSILPHDAGWKCLTESFAQILPGQPDGSNLITVPIIAATKTTLTVQLRMAQKPENQTPEMIIEQQTFALEAGEQTIDLSIGSEGKNQNIFVCFMKNDDVSVGLTSTILSGLLTVKQGGLAKVSTTARQEAPIELGVDSFDFWVPERRPNGQNIAFSSVRPIHLFAKENLLDGALRPTSGPNAWVAEMQDNQPQVSLEWQEPVQARELCLYADCDYDHPLESVQYHHNDRIMPHLVHACDVHCNGEMLTTIQDNHHGVIRIPLPKDQLTRRLDIRLANHQGHPVSLFGIRVQ
ncbi:FAD-dependent oxidoreductase [Cohaesibacter celericrescens]|uniref:FAD-binding dehydrogenase n=1 Tax=Cohaesibacter celericrescens TaxID=2067669 RepID=A0A2N5XLL4_9HYPH|nr:FAD-dependent oxidoreductase [Cohaesibacter celericrescens]PLW75421.1 FAD-binding dehydrogenase [Cohaesibacter celericrescens]